MLPDSAAAHEGWTQVAALPRRCMEWSGDVGPCAAMGVLMFRDPQRGVKAALKARGYREMSTLPGGDLPPYQVLMLRIAPAELPTAAFSLADSHGGPDIPIEAAQVEEVRWVGKSSRRMHGGFGLAGIIAGAVASAVDDATGGWELEWTMTDGTFVRVEQHWCPVPEHQMGEVRRRLHRAAAPPAPPVSSIRRPQLPDLDDLDLDELLFWRARLEAHNLNALCDAWIEGLKVLRGDGGSIHLLEEMEEMTTLLSDEGFVSVEDADLVRDSIEAWYGVKEDDRKAYLRELAGGMSRDQL
jgi:hypothetical protein